jgi:hypothetical protein
VIQDQSYFFVVVKFIVTDGSGSAFIKRIRIQNRQIPTKPCDADPKYRGFEKDCKIIYFFIVFQSYSPRILRETDAGFLLPVRNHHKLEVGKCLSD